jgi:hypothetical protein
MIACVHPELQDFASDPAVIGALLALAANPLSTSAVMTAA